METYSTDDRHSSQTILLLNRTQPPINGNTHTKCRWKMEEGTGNGCRRSQIFLQFNGNQTKELMLNCSLLNKLASGKQSE